MLRFGAHSTIDWSDWNLRSVTAVGEPALPPIADVAASAAAALRSPLSFPPLAQAVVPGDRVSLALAPGTPQPVALLRGVVAALVSAGVSAGDVRLLVADGDPSTVDSASLATAAAELAIDYELHDPARSESLTYLAASHDAQPIYLNRSLIDADFVIPIGAAGPTSALWLNAGSALYPAFSDRAALARSRQAIAKGGTASLRRARSEADEVAWLLGAQIAIQCVPGPENGALDVLAGSLGVVGAEAAARRAAAWEFACDSRSEFIVASISGDESQQTWANLGATLAALDAVAHQSSTIVICSEIEAAPGPAVRLLASGADGEQALRQAFKERLPDVVAGAALRAATERHRVYLLSRLDAELVEELGMGALGEPAQIARVARPFKSCLAVANAQFAMPRLAKSVAKASMPRRA